MRLTKKDLEMLDTTSFYGKTEHRQICEQALNECKEYKNIEEELGIDLVTLFKALKQGFVFVKENGIIEKNKGCNLCDLEIWSQIKLNPKDYGKTWALTKEELL